MTEEPRSNPIVNWMARGALVVFVVGACATILDRSLLWSVVALIGLAGLVVLGCMPDRWLK